MEKNCVSRNKVEHNFLNLKKALFDCDLTFTELGKRANLDKSTIDRWFNEVQFPSDSSLQKILPVLNDIQKRKGLKPYSIQYLKGEIECKTPEMEEIYKITNLKDDAVQTLQNLSTKDEKENSSHLIPSDSVLTNVNIANFIISNEKMWNTLYAETKKALENILKEHSFQTTSYEDVISSIDTYKSDELNNTINTVFNDLIKDMLKYYYKKKEQ